MKPKTRGKGMTGAELRQIAQDGGEAWCELVEYSDPEKTWDCPVSFERIGVDEESYYVHEVYNEDISPDEEEILGGLLEGSQISVCLTDYYPDEFPESEHAAQDFDEGFIAFYHIED